MASDSYVSLPRRSPWPGRLIGLSCALGSLALAAALALGSIDPFSSLLRSPTVEDMASSGRSGNRRLSWAEQTIRGWRFERIDATSGERSVLAEGELARPLGDDAFAFEKVRIALEAPQFKSSGEEDESGAGPEMEIRAAEGAGALEATGLRFSLGGASGPVFVTSPSLDLEMPRAEAFLPSSPGRGEEAGGEEGEEEDLAQRARGRRFDDEALSLTAPGVVTARIKGDSGDARLVAEGGVTLRGRDRLELRGPVRLELPKGFAKPSESQSGAPSLPGWASSGLRIDAGAADIRAVTGADGAPRALDMSFRGGVRVVDAAAGVERGRAETLTLLLVEGHPADEVFAAFGGPGGAGLASRRSLRTPILERLSAEGDVALDLPLEPDPASGSAAARRLVRAERVRMDARSGELEAEGADAAADGVAGSLASLEERDAGGAVLRRIRARRLLIREDGTERLRVWAEDGWEAELRRVDAEGEARLVRGSGERARLWLRRASAELRLERLRCEGSPAALHQTQGADILDVRAAEIDADSERLRLEGAVAVEARQGDTRLELAGDEGVLWFAQDPFGDLTAGASGAQVELRELSLRGAPGQLTSVGPEGARRLTAEALRYEAATRRLDMRGGLTLTSRTLERGEWVESRAVGEAAQATFVADLLARRGAPKEGEAAPELERLELSGAPAVLTDLRGQREARVESATLTYIASESLIRAEGGVDARLWEPREGGAQAGRLRGARAELRLREALSTKGGAGGLDGLAAARVEAAEEGQVEVELWSPGQPAARLEAAVLVWDGAARALDAAARPGQRLRGWREDGWTLVAERARFLEAAGLLELEAEAPARVEVASQAGELRARRVVLHRPPGDEGGEVVVDLRGAVEVKTEGGGRPKEAGAAPLPASSVPLELSGEAARLWLRPGVDEGAPALELVSGRLRGAPVVIRGRGVEPRQRFTLEAPAFRMHGARTRSLRSLGPARLVTEAGDELAAPELRMRLEPAAKGPGRAWLELAGGVRARVIPAAKAGKPPKPLSIVADTVDASLDLGALEAAESGQSWRAVQSLDARGGVSLEDAAVRATGDRLVYDAATRRGRLTGRPARVERKDKGGVSEVPEFVFRTDEVTLPRDAPR